jgi:hypothetical protein
MAGKDAGVEALCPGCGQTVLQKAMIPVLAEGGGVAYLCVACARLHIQTEPVANADPEAAADEATESPVIEEAESTSAAPMKSRSRRTSRPDRPLRARAPRAADA